MNTQIKTLGIRTVALILLIAALLFGGASITGVAAQSAIPGDALYPVKTTIEQTRLSLAQDAGDRAQMKMDFAEQRLAEIAALIAEGRYREVNTAVLAFEADIHSAILELETIAEIDPARATRIALEITTALTRYAQTLSAMVASAPQSVKLEVTRALDTTQVASGLELPSAGLGSDDNANSNGADDNANTNSDDDSANTNSDDDSANMNGVDDSANTNSADDSANMNGVDDSTNTNSADDSASTNSNASDDNGNSSGGGGHGGNGNGNSSDD